MIFYVNIVVLFIGCDFVKYSWGVGCLLIWVFYIVLIFFFNGKKINK